MAVALLPRKIPARVSALETHSRLYAVTVHSVTSNTLRDAHAATLGIFAHCMCENTSKPAWYEQ